MFLTAAENRCIKSMPKMDENGTCPEIRSELQKNSFSKLVFIQGDSIRLVSAAIIAPPLAVATLIVGSDSKVAPNTHVCQVYNQKM